MKFIQDHDGEVGHRIRGQQELRIDLLICANEDIRSILPPGFRESHDIVTWQHTRQLRVLRPYEGGQRRNVESSLLRVRGEGNADGQIGDTCLSCTSWRHYENVRVRVINARYLRGLLRLVQLLVLPFSQEIANDPVDEVRDRDFNVPTSLIRMCGRDVVTPLS